MTDEEPDIPELLESLSEKEIEIIDTFLEIQNMLEKHPENVQKFVLNQLETVLVED